MLCERCGTQITEGINFCPKCGAKIICTETSQQETYLKEQEMAETVRKGESAGTKEDKERDFREYVDKHVQKTTKFQSAKELLSSKVPLRFVKISFGIPALFGVGMCIFGDASLFETLVVSVFIVLAFGYLAAYIACGKVSAKFLSKYVGKFEGDIDIDDLRQFLDTHLSYLYPYFHKWGYLKKEGTSWGGLVDTTISEMMSKALKEVKICTEFGEKQWRLLVICIRPDTKSVDSGKKEYFFTAENRIDGPSFISHDMGFAKYKCLVKTAPIMQAAMEYYVENHKAKQNCSD